MRRTDVLSVPFFLLPIVACAVIVADRGSAVRPEFRLEFADVVVLSAAGLWLVFYFVAARRPGMLPKFLAASYSVMFSALVMESWTQRQAPAAGLPHPPAAFQDVVPPDFERITGTSDVLTFTVNRYGLRGPDERPSDSRRSILCVGGSTTQCRALSDEASWPWLLMNLLRERGESVYIGSAGRAGHCLIHNTYLIEHYPHLDEFNTVICLAGTNDLCGQVFQTREDRLAKLHQDVLTTERRGLLYRRSALLHRLRELLVQPSLYNSWTYDIRTYREDFLRHTSYRRVAMAAQTIAEPPADFETMVATYQSDLRSLIEACRLRNLKLILVTQPHRYGENVTPEIEETFMIAGPDFGYSPGAFRRMFDRFNEALREVAAEENVQVIDVASQADWTPWLYNDCHLNVAGSRALAEMLAAELRGRTDRSSVEFAPRGG